MSSSDSDVTRPTTIVNQEDNEATENNSYITRLLGNDPSIECSLGPPIDENIATRWGNYVLNGLDKETRENLTGKWKIPENCELLTAPKMNVETEGLLTSLDKKKDAVLSTFQDKIGKGLGALGNVLTALLSEKIPENIRSEFSPILADAGKMFCEVHHLISKHRKHQVYPLLNQTVQKVAEEAKSEKWLFGPDFGEKCKATQNIKKVTSEMGTKMTKKSDYKPNYFLSRRQIPHTKMKRQGYTERRAGRPTKFQNRQQEPRQQRRRYTK